ncbi:hypothetical protein ES703_11369 [subsurface metagenome]
MGDVVIHFEVQKKLGLTKSEYCIMDVIEQVVGDRKDLISNLREVRIARIADYIGLSASRTTKIIEDLVSKGLLTRGIEVHSQRLCASKKWYDAVQPYGEKESGEQKKN